MKKRIFLCAICICLLLSGCRQVITTTNRTPFDASNLSFTPTVYYANEGKICLLYDNETDEVEWRENEYELVVCEKKAGLYAVSVIYERGVKNLNDAEAELRAELKKGRYIRISETQNKEFAGYVCREILCNTEDGSASHVRFGVTKTGYFEVHDILSVEASDEQAKHMNDIVSSITFAPFTETDLVP